MKLNKCALLVIVLLSANIANAMQVPVIQGVTHHHKLTGDLQQKREALRIELQGQEDKLKKRLQAINKRLVTEKNTKLQKQLHELHIIIGANLNNIKKRLAALGA